MSKRIHCLAHVLRAIDRKLNTIKEKKIRLAIRQDIVNFHHYAREDNFITIIRLMIQKWKTKYADNTTIIKDFVDDYFNKMWSSPLRMGWFDHYCDNVPVTNNAIESTNRYVKENGKLY